MVMFIERLYLGFIGQAAKRFGKDNSVIVLCEDGSAGLLRILMIV